MRRIGITVAAFALAAFLPVSAHADIINLDPTNATCEGEKGDANEELAFAESCGGTFDLTLGFGSDGSSASFNDDYTYTSNADLSGGTLVWNGLADPDGNYASFTCPTCILVVADGAGHPIYGFNLGDWDGGIVAGQVITLSSFYDETEQGSGAISHVKIYFGPGTSGGGGSTGGGGGSTGVPEPTSLALFGVAALALAARVRRQRRVTA